MLLNLQGKIKEDKQFKILRVTNQEILIDFCNVATEVYEIEPDQFANIIPNLNDKNKKILVNTILSRE